MTTRAKGKVTIKKSWVIEDRFEKGLKTREMAKKYGISEAQMLRVIERFGLKGTRPKRNKFILEDDIKEPVIVQKEPKVVPIEPPKPQPKPEVLDPKIQTELLKSIESKTHKFSELEEEMLNITLALKADMEEFVKFYKKLERVA